MDQASHPANEIIACVDMSVARLGTMAIKI